MAFLVGTVRSEIPAVVRQGTIRVRWSLWAPSVIVMNSVIDGQWAKSPTAVQISMNIAEAKYGSTRSRQQPPPAPRLNPGHFPPPEHLSRNRKLSKVIYFK